MKVNMLLLSLSLFGVTLGILLIVIYCVVNDKYWNSPDWLLSIGLILMLPSFILLFTISVICADKNLGYKNFKAKYDAVKMIQNSPEDIRDASYTQDLIEINSYILDCRAKIDSPWYGLLQNKKICELDLLEKDNAKETVRNY